MSVHKSYFSRNNTIIYNSYTNTGRNPVTELYFGSAQDTLASSGFSRFIFDIDLTQLQTQLATGEISTGCTPSMTHVLNMTNTSAFAETELLNTFTSDGRRRATSFDLVLFRIPKVSGTTGNAQSWDEGVGYDFYDFQTTQNSSFGQSSPTSPFNDKAFSTRPSNYYQATTLSGWSQNGIYDNTNSNAISGLNYTGLTIVDTQHFEFGDENIEFDMTNEINDILTGATSGNVGWGIAYLPQLENITGLTENYSVGFFTRHTQTFYEPYLETTYDDLIDDDRNLFVENRTNKLYLYVYENGDFVNLDSNPVVNIQDNNGTTVFSNLSSCRRAKGVYEVSVPPINGYTTPCMFYDIWSSIVLNGVTLANITNEVILQPYTNLYIIGTQSKEPALYGFDASGINQNEKILNTDIRKVSVNIKKAYTSRQPLYRIQADYRVYVKEGTTEVQVQDWTELNRTPNEYYFIFDTRDKIPNEYFIDIRVSTSGQKDTYKRQIQFEIVNKK